MIWKTVWHGTTEILIEHLSAQKKENADERKRPKKRRQLIPFNTTNTFIASREPNIFSLMFSRSFLQRQ
jgi:hypothetical protein